MEKWNWEVINGEVFIVCDGKKIAKMLPDEVGQEQMIGNASILKVAVNGFLEKQEELSKP